MDDVVGWVARNVPLGWIAFVGLVLMMLLCPPVTVVFFLTAGPAGIVLAVILVAGLALLITSMCEARIKHVEREARMGKFKALQD